MEFFGYHVFNSEYELLTEEQALFLDLGLVKIYKDFFGGSEEDNKTLNKFGKPRKRRRF